MQAIRPAVTAASAVLLIDRVPCVLAWPESAEAMFGWTCEEALGKRLFDLLEGQQAGATNAILGWEACRFLSTRRHCDGSLVPVDVAFEPLRGTATQGVVSLQWVDARLPVSAADAEARYESVIAAMQEGVVVQGLDGRILATNPSAERILGLTAEQLHGRDSVDPRWRSVHADGSAFPCEQHPAMVTLRTGEPQSNVVMGVVAPDGSQKWISINSQPIRQAPTRPHHAVVATFSDITERRTTEAQLREVLRKNESLVDELRAALDRVKTLSGLLPVCAWCKSVRDDQGYWQQIEHYLAEHTEAKLTHGLCPTCSDRMMAD